MKNGNSQERLTVHINVPEELYLKLAGKSVRTGCPVEALVLSALRRDLCGILKRKEGSCSGK